MRISVFGLGYVGLVTSTCFSKLGHDITGVDISEYKVNKLNNAETPIKEEGLDELLKEAVRNKKFIATTNPRQAIENSDISFICVRSPFEEKGLNISEIENVCQSIAESLLNKRGKQHVIVIRSTVPPCTIENLEKTFQEKGLRKGEDFNLAVNPEFLREGTAVKDFFDPSYVVIGADNNDVLETLALIYSELDTKIYKVSTKTAETIKFLNNSWHALEIAFTNEVSAMSKKLGINVKELMDLFASDTKLNLSPYYFQPNMGYGGSCLPKDLRALQRLCADSGINCNILDSVSKSNITQIKRSYEVIKQELEKRETKQVGILGVSFKPGTDDVRGSPILYIIEKLKSDGFEVKIYDPVIKKEDIEKIKMSYREVIYDPLLKELMDIRNFKDLLEGTEKLLSPKEEVLSSEVIVLNTKISQDILNNLSENQILINTRSINPLDKTNIKAKYVEIW